MIGYALLLSLWSLASANSLQSAPAASGLIKSDVIEGGQAGGWKFECSAASPLPLALGFREAQPPPIFEANSCENTLQKEIATRDKILKLQSVLL